MQAGGQAKRKLNTSLELALTCIYVELPLKHYFVFNCVTLGLKFALHLAKNPFSFVIQHQTASNLFSSRRSSKDERAREKWGEDKKKQEEGSFSASPLPLSLFFVLAPLFARSLISRRSPRGKEEITRSLSNNVSDSKRRTLYQYQFKLQINSFGKNSVSKLEFLVTLK